MSVRTKELELARRLIAGDEAAFEQFADRQIPALHRFAGRRLDGDRELTRDIVQSTLCKAITKLASFRGEAALSTWLCACCRNEIAAHFRRYPRSRREIDLELVEQVEAGELAAVQPEGAEGALLRREVGTAVHRALDALPVHYSRALEWKYIDCLSVQEIARRLDLGLKAAESVLTRARLAFRGEYTDPASAGRPATKIDPVASVSLGAES